MATGNSRPKLLAVVGPTASGKSELALRAAQSLDGEIIAADSRTVYKAMDIGTAKPSRAEQAAVPHFGLDLVEPGDSFNASQFKVYADAQIKDISSRGHLPILVGGTGLYIDAVLYDFKFRTAADPEQRARLEDLTTDKLRAQINELGLPMPENDQNRRHLIRIIESQGQSAERRHLPIPDTLIVGLRLPDDELKSRIATRIDHNFESLVVETKDLLKTYGESALRRSAGIPYLAALDFFAGKKNKTEALETIKTAEWQYARRQKTWFKRNPHIHWFTSGKSAESFINKCFRM